ncbi:MAG: DUF4349 domain-containing protein [Armatimonadetes bacterium]|nr:DUF4349 domain-containing protein [Armatimonadota bacterium]
MKPNLLFASLACLVTSQAFSQTSPSAEKSLSYENASITLKVKDFGQFEKSLIAELGGASGTTLNSKGNVSAKGRPYAYWQFKVSANQLEAFLAKVEGLGTSVGKSRKRVDLMPEVIAIDNQQRRLVELKSRLESAFPTQRNIRASDRLYLISKLHEVGLQSDALALQRKQLVSQDGEARVQVMAFKAGWDTNPFDGSTANKPSPMATLKHSVRDAGYAVMGSVIDFFAFLLKAILPLTFCWILLRKFGPKIAAWWKRAWSSPTEPTA